MELRGIIHAHSRYSYDAKESLADLKTAFAAAGLRFACMTEHTDGLSLQSAEAFIRECHELSDDNFLFIPGFEMPYLGTHILLLGAETFPFREHDLRGSLASFTEAGALAVIAHPHRNGFHTDDFMLKHCAAAEVWNSQYDGKRYPRPGALSLLARLRRGKPGMKALAGIDLHRMSHFGGPSLRLNAERVDRDGVIAVLRQGDYVIEGRNSRIASDGTLLSPPRWQLVPLALAGMAAVRAAHAASHAAKVLGLHRTRWFSALRDKLRKHL